MIKYSEGGGKMKKRKFSLKLFLFFMISFLIIAFMHISFNATIMSRQPSPNWSRSFAISSFSYTREIVADITEEGDIIILSPVKDGKEILKVTKLGKNMQIKEEYEAIIDKLNINRISSDDILLVGEKLYWRDNKDNILYTSILDNKNKKISRVDRVQHNIIDFDVTEDNKYLAVAFLDGNVNLYEEVNGEYNDLGGPSDLGKVEMVNLKVNDNIVYLQTATFNKNNSKKEVYITEYKNNKWNKSLYMTSMLELKNQIKDIDFAMDSDYVYSISSIQGDVKTSYAYIINGYNKESKELLDELKTRWAMDLKIQDFSSKPVMFDSNKEGVTVFTTAPSSLDIRVTNSNVIKLNLTKNGFNSAELVSNTKKWSNQVTVLRNNNGDYVLWNEAGGFGSTIIMGTSNNNIVLKNNTEVTTEDIKQSIEEEIPFLANLLIVLVGARFFSILPSIIWTLCMFFWYSKIEKRSNLYLFVGIIIYLLSQLASMDFYYQKIHIMPEYLTTGVSKYVILLLFAVLATIFANIYNKESDEPEIYKTYVMYLLYFHVMINYLFVPYLF